MSRQPGRAGAAILWLALWPAAVPGQTAPAAPDTPAVQSPATAEAPDSQPAQTPAPPPAGAPLATPTPGLPADVPVATPDPLPVQPPADPTGETPTGAPPPGAPTGPSTGATVAPSATDASPTAAQPQPPGQTQPVANPAAPSVIPSAMLTVDQDALYSGSAWGRRARAELDARRLDLQAENDRIAAELEAEDDALTALRPTLAADEFRRRADAFDARVQQVRAEREELGRALVASAEADRTAFLNAALPVFSEVMQERGASVILDRRTVFLSLDSIDATAELIARIDEAVGEGATPDVTVPDASDAPTSDAPTPDAPTPDAPAPDAAAPAPAQPAP